MPATIPNALGAAAPMQEWQDRFDFLLPRKEWLRSVDIARALEVTDTSVCHAYDKGRICGHEFHFRGTGERGKRLIPRDAAIAYLAATANYTPTERLQRIGEVLTTMHPRELVLIQQRIAQLIRAKS